MISTLGYLLPVVFCTIVHDAISAFSIRSLNRITTLLAHASDRKGLLSGLSKTIERLLRKSTSSKFS